jgi:membrane-bound hydrogenase subunit mbhJ
MAIVYRRWLRALPHPRTTAFPRRDEPGLFPPGSRPVEVLCPARRDALTASLAIRHIDVGSCGAPESEIALLTSPAYDISRFGFSFTPSPRHADLLLVTGSLQPAMAAVLRQTYEAMPEPRRVVALGCCGAADCPLRTGAEATEALGQVVPVDVFVPGCPPSPAAILAGLFAAVGRSAPGLRGHVAEGA